MGFERWMGAAARPPAWTLLGSPMRGVASWNVTELCNYDCRYCTQRALGTRARRVERLEEALGAFAALPGNWEIKLSGGEPFLQPGLADIARGLAARGHVVSVQTNFSAPDGAIRGFLEATRGSLHLFSASLHLDYASPDEFVDRHRRLLAPYEPLGLRFHVTSVAVPARLRQLRDGVAPLFRRRGIIFKVQPEKSDGAVREYDAEERRILLELGGHNLTGRIGHRFQGRLCHAGSAYLVVKASGKAFRCYPASRNGGRHALLGSLAEGLRLLDEARICPYGYCSCTVPIDRGMVTGEGPGRGRPCSFATSS